MVNIISLDQLYSLKASILDRIDLDNDFVKHYQRMILEDKSKPLFSQTQRYNSFPSNTKGDGKEWSNPSSSNKSGNNVPLQKIIITRGGNSEETDEKGLTRWTIAQSEIDKARQMFLGILNKISKSNLQELFQELMNHLQKYPYFEFYQVIHMDLYNKLLTDKNYHEFYIKIVSLLSKFKRFYESFVKVEKREGGYFYALKYYKKPETENWFGPYPNEVQLFEQVFIKHNVRNGMIKICEKEFSNRWNYIEEISKVSEEDKIVSLKRKLATPIETMLSMFEHNLVLEKTIPIVLKEVYKPNAKGEIIEECIYLLDLFVQKKYLKDECYIEMKEKIQIWQKDEKRTKRCSYYLEALLTKVDGLLGVSDKNINTKINVSPIIKNDFEISQNGIVSQSGIVSLKEEEIISENERDWNDFCEEAYSMDSIEWTNWLKKLEKNLPKENMDFWIFLIQFGLENAKSFKKLNEVLEKYNKQWKQVRKNILEIVENECLNDWELDIPTIRKSYKMLIEKF